jgi:hypothetical protein
MTALLPPASPAPGQGVAPQLRAAHAARDLAVDVLCAAAGDGRLTAAELDERLDGALTARTIGELAALTADLPGGELFQAARQPVMRNTLRSGDLTASRWALLQSLLNKPGPPGSVQGKPVSGHDLLDDGNQPH